MISSQFHAYMETIRAWEAAYELTYLASEYGTREERDAAYDDLSGKGDARYAAFRVCYPLGGE